MKVVEELPEIPDDLDSSSLRAEVLSGVLDIARNPENAPRVRLDAYKTAGAWVGLRSADSGEGPTRRRTIEFNNPQEALAVLKSATQEDSRE